MNSLAQLLKRPRILVRLLRQRGCFSKGSHFLNISVTHRYCIFKWIAFYNYRREGMDKNDNKLLLF